MSSQGRYAVLTCTPHFNSDTDNPWVTKENDKEKVLHYWFNPEKKQTLLEVAEGIEAWLLQEYEVVIKQEKAHFSGSLCVKVKSSEYHIAINTMEINGIHYDRETMAIKYATECLHDEQPIILKAKTEGGYSLALCCSIL